jgi:hypothetical protein
LTIFVHSDDGFARAKEVVAKDEQGFPDNNDESMAAGGTIKVEGEGGSAFGTERATIRADEGSDGGVAVAGEEAVVWGELKEAGGGDRWGGASVGELTGSYGAFDHV